ncbi:hypothetical protein QCD79_31195, partial [Pseudomonas quasicaspiana]|nr:hypothetical protein [Pseudomonas quasicaspiana]
PPMMADRLKPGLKVDLRFGSLQRVHTPVIVGTVSTVSADQLVGGYGGHGADDHWRVYPL